MNEIEGYNKCEMAKQKKKNIEFEFLALAQLLSEIREERAYSPMHDSFEEFLMELDISPGTASKLMSVYEKLVVQFQIPQQSIVDTKGWSKAYLVAKNCETKEEAEEWLERAKIAHRRDLEADFKETYQGIDQSACEHEFRILKICKKCNHKEEEFCG